MNELGYVCNQTDPCLYNKWDPKLGLIVWLSFIDDMLIVCKEVGMNAVKQQFTETVDCDDIGPIREYIGTKIDIDSKKIKLKIMQPVLVKSLIDEFMFNELSAKPDIPPTAGTHLVNSGIKSSAAAQTCYCSGVGKLLYLVKWSCLEITNSVCELTHFMTEAFPNSVKCMERVMQHVLSFPNHGVVMQPERHWDGLKNFQFKINGILYLGDATELELHKWCGVLQVFLNKAPIAHKSKMQLSVSLSMAEGELIAVVEVHKLCCLQCMCWNASGYASRS